MPEHKLSKKGLEFVKGFEMFVPYPYDDLVPMVRGKYREWKGGSLRGTATIGYGHTNAAAHPLRVSVGIRITEKEAEEILDVDLDDVEKHVNKVAKVPLTQGQFDALVSLSFNLGPLDVKARTLLNRLNSKDYDGARRAFDLYVRSKGKVLKGLQRRRDGEQVLWDEQDEPVKELIPDKPVEHPAQVDAVNPPHTLATKEGATLTTTGAVTLLHTASEATAQVAAIKRHTEDAGLWEILGSLASSPKFMIGVAITVALSVLMFWLVRAKRLEAAKP